VGHKVSITDQRSFERAEDIILLQNEEGAAMLVRLVP
jgi:hypothetical protein